MPDKILQFEALFNHATIGIVVTDQKGVIINFNKYAQDQFGYSQEEILGQPVEILIPMRQRHTHVHYRESFYDHPSHRKMGEGRDLNGQKKDGTVFPVEVSLSSYQIQGQVYVIAFIIDISVRKRNEEVVLMQKTELENITRQITQLNAELERKVDDRTMMLKETLVELERSKEELSQALETEKHLSELKSNFVTMASHEFRTPLSTILSSCYLAEQYLEGGEPAKIGRHLKKIKGAVAGLKAILEDFLSLGKLEEGLVESRPELLSPEECAGDIREVIQELQEIYSKTQTIHFIYSGEHSVQLDRHLLRNILMNLLSNAIKFSGESKDIKVTAKFEEQFSLSVEDKGIGISEDDQQFLAERFFRAKNALNIQGTGIGLHIVMKYLSLMNGYMEIKSQLNKGSTFIIYLPGNNKML